MHQPNSLFFLVAACVAISMLCIATKDWMFWFQFLFIAPSVWTFEEYLGHRFLLHAKPFEQYHRNHHLNPMNPNKIFIPFEITCLATLCNFIAFVEAVGFNYALANTASFIFCYFAFEWTHWKTHKTQRPAFCEFHAQHHGHSIYNFGFTSATWDIVFQTCNPHFKTSWILYFPFPIFPLMINALFFHNVKEIM
jgi:sterol desaturase/sphingolipid hydroxylase (fatty acid hydroxylase superfamily)